MASQLYSCVIHYIDNVIHKYYTLNRGDIMNQSILSVRVNKTDKENFEKFCSEAGMNVSTAINMFIKATNRERKLPFEVKTQSYEDYVIEKLKEAEEHYENGARTYTQEEVMEMIKNKLKK